MAISGGFAGLGGAMDMLGWQFRLGTLDVQTAAVGFTGIAVAFLGRNTAVGVMFAAFLFGALQYGTSSRSLDPDIFDPSLAGNLQLMIQALVLLFIGADVLILNHYGKDMVNSLTQAVQFGLRDKQVNGKNFEVVVPLFSELMAQGAGDAVKGIFGTGNWDWKLDNESTKTFTKSFGQEFGSPPSQAAHTCYVQALLYADAVERAGTFYPPEVIKALEGFEFDGMGNGATLYRADDHQCFKDVLVVQGKQAPANPFDLLEVVGKASREAVTYDPAIFGGELGPDTPALC